MTQPIATIDVGTNTALLLISEWKENRLNVLHDETLFVRLGQGVDAAGFINDAAMVRLGKTLDHFKTVTRSWGVSRVIIGATSASRDAANQKELIAFVRRETGLTYGILSGVEEAALSFAGVSAGLHSSEKTILSLDIGGGSTELTLGSLDKKASVITLATSLNIGSVRLTEKFFSKRPPASVAISDASQWLLEKLETLPDEYKKSDNKLIGASGTTTVLAQLEAADLKFNYKEQSILGVISRKRVQQWSEKLLNMQEAEVLALNPALMKGREDVFPAGVLILKTIMEFLGKDEVQVNAWGLRHGLALRYWNNSINLPS